MLATLIIVFREIMEAGLVVGIVLAATRGVFKRGRWVAAGIFGGVVGASLVAAFAGTIGEALQGTGQEIFNAGIMILAVLMLGWHNIWMATHGREIAKDMKAIGEDVKTGRRSLTALAIVVGIAVLREGSEVVLFLYGIILSNHETAFGMLTGGLMGVLLGCATSALMYFGLLRIPAKHLFGVTSLLITLLAAGMASQAVAFLQQSGHIDFMTDTVWNSSGILADSSIFGKIMHTLVGYTDRPSQLQLVVYVATLIVITVMMRVVTARSHKARQGGKQPVTA